MSSLYTSARADKILLKEVLAGRRTSTWWAYFAGCRDTIQGRNQC
ncbi:hypothetical protein ZEAMMB73_Zm00001d046582 [Zea mays]|uniref:Uncharacterized protein n=1 Tax=Zea mays TaxID=4577 RepID=A0A1D6P3R2_MAIZE|nr:hypothetical protein ZEAMMB73_Zm00001d046582 [Zea mays]